MLAHLLLSLGQLVMQLAVVFSEANLLNQRVGLLEAFLWLRATTSVWIHSCLGVAIKAILVKAIYSEAETHCGQAKIQHQLVDPRPHRLARLMVESMWDQTLGERVSLAQTKAFSLTEAEVLLSRLYWVFSFQRVLGLFVIHLLRRSFLAGQWRTLPLGAMSLAPLGQSLEVAFCPSAALRVD
jgi:hypothetical protein